MHDLSISYSDEYLPCEQAIVSYAGCVPVLFNFRSIAELRRQCDCAGIGAPIKEQIVRDVKRCRINTRAARSNP